MSSDTPPPAQSMRPYGGPSRFAGLDDGPSGTRSMPEVPAATSDSDPGHPEPGDPAGPGDPAAPDDPAGPAEPGDWAGRSVAVALVAGAAVAVVLGVYGHLHEPGKIAVSVAGFSGPGYVKGWLTTLAMLLGLVQLVSSLSMYGRLGTWSPTWIATAHRWSGRLAVLVSVPVVVHCLYALGFEYDRARVLIHSVAGCLFYGAFVTKMLMLSRRGSPSWAMPVLGGVVFAMLVLLWLTSSLWLFNDQGLHL